MQTLQQTISPEPILTWMNNWMFRASMCSRLHGDDIAVHVFGWWPGGMKECCVELWNQELSRIARRN